MENKTLKEQFLELSEKIMLSAEAGEFIDIADVLKYDKIVLELYESGEWEIGDAWDFAFACQQSMHEAANTIEELSMKLHGDETEDVKPVVLCRNCIHFQQFREHDGFCQIDGMLWNNDFFCSNGKRVKS